jgi:hypothetical protein
VSRLSQLVEGVAAKNDLLQSHLNLRKIDDGWKVFEEQNISSFSEAVGKFKKRSKYRGHHSSNPSEADSALALFEDEISTSKFILDLEDDDDPAVRPYSDVTLRRAVDFVRRLALHAHSDGFRNIEAPKIRPASSGSIDLFWEKRDATLLINYSPLEPSYAYYFGQSDGNEISGRFKCHDDAPELICWLERL